MRTYVLTAVLTLVLTSALHATTPPSPSGKVNVNTATEAQLMLLPGVGPKLASAIHDAAETGPAECDHKCQLKSLTDLDNVKGVGAATLKALTPYVTFSGPTTLTSKVKRSRPVPTAAPRPVSGTRCGPGVRCGG